MIRRYKNKIIKRKILVRSRVKKSGLPRLSVFRSNKYIYGQIIDDQKHITLVASSSREVLKTTKKSLEQAKKTGELLAQKALKKGIKKVVFDRGTYRYHGRVKALAEGARSKGLKI